MPKIRVLPDILASQVAAGEVVERPASVVKELVENSIDAGAQEIRVDMDRGGSALIRVSDDGCGMSREDALLSLERHATSKLRTAGDLAAILTLGFRGEAVPSIASVSRFRLVTREKDAVAGTEIVVDGGRVNDVRDAGCAPGTVIEAKSLFFNMPARRKFLRAETTEAAHVEHQLRLHALAAPWVRFRLRRDDREVFDLPAVAKPLDRVRQLLGTDLSRELISLPLTHGNGVTVEGYVLPASHARKGRRHQFVFLNGRPVEDSVISRALAEGFRGALADGLHPAAWLWIELEPTLVDVNVHPAKREVRFHKPLDVRDAILDAVLAGLKPAPPPAPLPVVRPPLPDLAVDVVETAPSRTVFRAPQPVLANWDQATASAPVPQLEEMATLEPAVGAVPDFRIIGLLHQRYVLLESGDGLVLFDPKAARERIIFEKLTQHDGTALETQGLLMPVLLELDPRDLDLVIRERMALQEAGIEVEAFGGNTLQIRSLPACVTVEDPRAFLGALMDELLHESSPGVRFALSRVAKIIAKRAAMPVQPRLAETMPLLAELFACDLPYCAADGRPTLSEFGMRELDRRFGVSRG
ncbi:DNA mismatch repair endonuclease MutL [Luteolibacter yonseiensis]|uniref:DNA mismatch repair protein MutL n=1 Tax=Luteolibacter yonseiensis TaxID=1144680 RepID=A0A934R3M2_9BACT|nr:DNA mismatch repair endonuclease MutL [Luteolibacter yonseiensis]MBK1815686.1 DNA mismatch repair endonuclease MutL [Luteolibacter yonseiensis]